MASRSLEQLLEHQRQAQIRRSNLTYMFSNRFQTFTKPVWPSGKALHLYLPRFRPFGSYMQRSLVQSGVRASVKVILFVGEDAVGRPTPLRFCETPTDPAFDCGHTESCTADPLMSSFHATQEPSMSVAAFQLEHKAKVNKCPCYPDIFSVLALHPDSVYVDVGCFTGIDARRVALDGWPQEQVVGIDANPKWFSLGWQLFQDKNDTRIQFIACDLLRIPTEGCLSLVQEKLSLKRGRIRVISAFALFHLYSEEQQLQLAKRMWSMLEKQPGSMIFGIQRGVDKPTRMNVPAGKEGQDVFFCHSPTSWTALWATQIDDTLDVQAELVASQQRNAVCDMVWSVRIV